VSDAEPLPPTWDWVEARAACSARQFFERLYLGAQANLATRTRLLTADEHGPRMAFQHTATPQAFSVFTRLDTGPVVRVRVDGPQISIDGDDAFAGTVTLDDQGRCRLRVGTEDLDEWQVLKRALEGFLFPR
jgi:hypothetical protein